MSLDRGERLKNARKRAGLTQLELAERCPDVSLSQLRRIESGNTSRGYTHCGNSR
ncbi:helix-turn-helix domain-containing protein [Nocardia tengchongensis]|uniref:helix-turn-helix domain-containing protein n=1 Tax=Nocardia tengchongensis TaxID=2055889 RepID=UPI0036A56279